MLLPRAKPPVDFSNRPITLRVTVRKLQIPVVFILIERDIPGKTRYVDSVPERGEQIVMITDPSEQTVSHFEGEKLIASDLIDDLLGGQSSADHRDSFYLRPALHPSVGAAAVAHTGREFPAYKSGRVLVAHAPGLGEGTLATSAASPFS